MRDFEKRRILVTGGAGFIGSHLCEFLVKKGATVTSIDNFCDYYDPDLKKMNIELVELSASLAVRVNAMLQTGFGATLKDRARLPLPTVHAADFIPIGQQTILLGN